MAKTIENLFRILHYSADLLVIVIFLTYFISRKVKSKELGFIALYSITDFTLNILSNYFSPTEGLYIWSTFTFFEYSIFTFIIWTNIKKTFFRHTIVVASIAFIVFTTIYNFATNFSKIDSIPIGIETILILIYSFYYLYEQTNDTTTLFIYNKHTFWLVIGFLIYLAGSFFIYIFASRMEEKLLNQYWHFTNIFYAIMNILFAIAFYVKAREQNLDKKYSYNLRPSLN